MQRETARAADIEAIYRQRFPAFVSAATAILRGDGEAARDVVQDAFALALRRRSAVRADDALEAWIWRIVINVARDRIRRGTVEARRLAQIASTPPAEPPAENYRHEDLRVLILALPERQRLAVFLRYYADLSYEQIADVLGVKTGTVAASLNAAHASLRMNFAEEVAR